MAGPSYQVFPDRSANHLMFLVSHVLLHDGFSAANYASQRTRDEATAAYRVMGTRPVNVVGCIVELPFTYGNIYEIGAVGPCVLRGRTISVHSLRVSTALVNGQTIDFWPAYEKLIIVPSPDAASRSLKLRPTPRTLASHTIASLEDFARRYLHQFAGSDRVHPDFHVNVNLSYPPAVRVMSPQECLLLHVDASSGKRPSYAAEASKDEVLEEVPRKPAEGEGEVDFDLFDETLIDDECEGDLADVSAEGLVAVYVAHRYRPALSLPFKGRSFLAYDPAFDDERAPNDVDSSIDEGASVSECLIVTNF
ncbi:unnamed protein product [Peniophora sp. CBMAI 1063]|nr:unnamed protein product [Peniophora sp. CBMAI 1063]